MRELYPWRSGYTASPISAAAATIAVMIYLSGNI
jgi:hypothetical protein